MTPAQLRAYSEVVQHGSVKDAAAALGVSDAAVSGHVAALRRELDDPLFQRTGPGLAFTPGGLRLAARAVELLGLQATTRREVRAAAQGRRVLRLATTSLFAEHAAAGLIELFSGRADDLEVQLVVGRGDRLGEMLRSRAADVVVAPSRVPDVAGLEVVPFLRYEVALVAAPPPDGGRAPSVREAATRPWVLGPSAAEPTGATRQLVEQLRVPEQAQRIYQSHAAALAAARAGAGVAPALAFAVAEDLRAARLVRVAGPEAALSSTWTAIALPREQRGGVAHELLRFVTTPRALRAMIAGSGADVGRFRPAVHVTIWR